MRIGLIGAGALAAYLLEKESTYNYVIHSVFVRDAQKYERLAETNDITLYTDFDAFLQSDIDLVVEVAGGEAAAMYGKRTVTKKDMLIISIGAFVDETFAADIEQIAQENQHQIYLPSGAIGGLDIIQNAKDTNELAEVMIATRKPAHSLVAEALTAEKIVFDGVAKDAIEKFPKNVNIAIALSLAGIGVDYTRVQIIADPFVTTNQHEITAKGPFGSVTIQLENEPLPSNPKSSFITAMSIIGTIERIGRTIKIGS